MNGDWKGISNVNDFFYNSFSGGINFAWSVTQWSAGSLIVPLFLLWVSLLTRNSQRKDKLHVSLISPDPTPLHFSVQGQAVGERGRRGGGCRREALVAITPSISRCNERWRGVLFCCMVLGTVPQTFISLACVYGFWCMLIRVWPVGAEVNHW